MQLTQKQTRQDNVHHTDNTGSTGDPKRNIDVAVVGGGLAGLTTAALLARKGKQVVLFERSASVGGRAISQEHCGYLFNLGAHALYTRSPASEVLDELGIAYTGGTPTGIRATHSGGNYVAPVNTRTLLKTRLLTLREKWQAGRLLMKLQMADPRRYANISLAQWLDKEAPTPRVREVLVASARTATYTNAPELLGMDVVIAQTKQVLKGKVVYLDGGWQTLVDGLVRAATTAGVRIVTGTRVEQIEQQNGAACGVRLADGTVYTASAVVVAAAPRDFLSIFEGYDASMRGWLESSVQIKAACLDVALRRLPRPDNKVVMSVDHPLFLTAQSEFSKVGPQGGALIYTLKYLDPTVPQDAEENRRDLEAWLDETQPGWRDELFEQRYLPNLVVNNALPMPSNGGLAGRPGPAVPGIAGVYVVGDWVGSSGLLASASLGSAKLAAQMILQSSGASAHNLSHKAAMHA